MRNVWGLMAVVAAAAASLPGGAAAQERIELVSQNFRGRGDAAEGASQGPAVSADGRFVAFYSDAIDLVTPNDNLPFRDVFVRDQRTGTTERISVTPDGREGNGHSQPGLLASPGISGDGCLVVFSSEASNLIEGDGNGVEDIFVRDRCAGSTERVSRGRDGQEPNGGSSFADISLDGRIVVFQSQASNLVENDNNGAPDVFAYDRDHGETRRVSVAEGGGDANGASSQPAVSGDGTRVAFASRATNIVPRNVFDFQQIYLVHLDSGQTELISVSTSDAVGRGDSFGPALDREGTIVAFKSDAPNLVPGDTNGIPDTFVRDRNAAATEIVSVDSFGNFAQFGLSAYPSVSADGRYVSFPSVPDFFDPTDGNNQPDIFVHDRDSRRTERVSVERGSDESEAGVTEAPPSVSADGRRIAFSSASTKLVSNADVNSTFDVFLSCNPLNPPCPEPTPTRCIDEECQENEVCDPDSNTCATRTPTPCNPEECQENEVCDPDSNMCATKTPTPCNPEECQENEVCDPDSNMCATPTPTPCNPEECQENEVCDPDSNMCATPTPTPCNPEECPAGEVCDPESNMCATRTPTRSVTPGGGTNTPTRTPTTAGGGGGGGGGCSCEIDPRTREGAIPYGLGLVVPALLWWRRRRLVDRGS